MQSTNFLKLYSLEFHKLFVFLNSLDRSLEMSFSYYPLKSCILYTYLSLDKWVEWGQPTLTSISSWPTKYRLFRLLRSDIMTHNSLKVVNIPQKYGVSLAKNGFILNSYFKKIFKNRSHGNRIGFFPNQIAIFIFRHMIVWLLRIQIEFEALAVF